jgi:hypothetical protein
MASFTYKPFSAQQYWSSSDKKEFCSAIEKTLPKLKCLCCGGAKFVINDIFSRDTNDQFRARLTYYSRTSVSNFATTPVMKIHCEECGFVMKFDELTVLSNAGFIIQDAGVMDGNDGS